MYYIYSMQKQSAYTTNLQNLFIHLIAMNEGLLFRVALNDKRSTAPDGYGITGVEFLSLMEAYAADNSVYECEISAIKLWKDRFKMNSFTVEQIKGFEDRIRFVDVRVRSREADAYQAERARKHEGKKAAKAAADSLDMAA